MKEIINSVVYFVCINQLYVWTCSNEYRFWRIVKILLKRTPTIIRTSFIFNENAHFFFSCAQPSHARTQHACWIMSLSDLVNIYSSMRQSHLEQVGVWTLVDLWLTSDQQRAYAVTYSLEHLVWKPSTVFITSIAFSLQCHWFPSAFYTC